MNAKVLPLLAGVLSLTAAQENPVPLVDHHYHLFNTTMTQSTPGLQPITASDAVRALDRAGVGRAVLLSVAYQFGNPNRPTVPNEYAAVQAENDRISREVARYPDCFRGFCGINPLKDMDALAEIAAVLSTRISASASSCTSAIRTWISKTWSTAHACARCFTSRTPAGWPSWFTCARP